MNPASEHFQEQPFTNKIVEKALKALKPIRKTKNKTKPKEFNVARLFRKKRGYNKLSEEKLAVFEDFFLKNKYPNKEEYKQIAAKTKEKSAKIENWFKQKRRKAVFNGIMTFQVFSEYEQKILMNEFLKNQNPQEHQIRAIANCLKCKSQSVRNWFNYKRKIASKIQPDPRKTDLINFLIKQSDNPEEENNDNIESKCSSKSFNMNQANKDPKAPLEPTNASHNSPKNDPFDSNCSSNFQNKNNFIINLPPFFERLQNPMLLTAPAPIFPRFMKQMMYIDAFSNYMRTMTFNAVMSNMMMTNAVAFGMKKEA